MWGVALIGEGELHVNTDGERVAASPLQAALASLWSISAAPALSVCSFTPELQREHFKFIWKLYFKFAVINLQSLTSLTLKYTAHIPLYPLPSRTPSTASIFLFIPAYRTVAAFLLSYDPSSPTLLLCRTIYHTIFLWYGQLIVILASNASVTSSIYLCSYDSSNRHFVLFVSITSYTSQIFSFLNYPIFVSTPLSYHYIFHIYSRLIEISFDAQAEWKKNII